MNKKLDLMVKKALVLLKAIHREKTETVDDSTLGVDN